MDIDLNILQVLLSLLGGGGLLGASTYLYKRFKQRVIVKLVKNSNDTDLDDFILLYDDVIEENTRITPDEIMRFIGCHKPNKGITICDYLFLCKKESVVIGFLKALYCVEKKILFIAYLGIHKGNEIARKQAALSLYKKVKRLLKGKYKGCKSIIFEVETTQITKSNAKLRLFKNAAQRYKFKCYRFDINYCQPEIPTDTGYIPGEQTALMLIPFECEISTKLEIDKETMISYLDFLYSKIYGRVYADTDLNQVYKSYLNDLLNEYKQKLPEKIKLIE